MHYLIESPELSFTFLGTVRDAEPGMVWLCKPDGEPVLKVPAQHVKPSNPEETAKRILADVAVHRRLN